jgi:ubiquinone biosynthesis protein Coq4
MNNPLKTFKMLRGFYLLSRNPNRLEQVFEIADGGEDPRILREVADHVSKEPQGKRAMEKMPRIGELDLKELATLPKGTLGHEYAQFMLSNGLDPASIPVPDLAPDRDVRYVKAHLRETHDIWHVVTGFGPDVAGEIGLQAFYMAQLPSRLSAILIAMAFIHIATVNIGAREAIMTEVIRGYQIGKRAKQFFGVEWKTMWSMPLDEVRAKLDVEPNLRSATLPETQKYEYRPAA